MIGAKGRATEVGICITGVRVNYWSCS